MTDVAHAGMVGQLLRTIGDAIGRANRSERRLCILNYHRVLGRPDPLLEGDPDIETFRWQMRLLACCFNVLPLGEAIERMTAGSLPARSVAVTFDDGYRCVHEIALPVLREYGIPATVFVASGYLDGGNMWNDRIVETIRHLRVSTLDLRGHGLDAYPIGTEWQRNQAVRKLTGAVKYMTPDARQALTRTLESIARAPAGDGLMLTPDMLRSLARQGVEIGGHTVSHPILSRLSDEEARSEIVDNKQVLETLVGKPVRLFAYPNGKAGVDFDARHIALVRDAGYQFAFCSSSGAASRHDARFLIPRGLPWDRTPFAFGARLLHWLAGGGRKPEARLAEVPAA